MYFFYCSHRQCDVLHWGKTLFKYCQKCFNNKKLAAIRSQHHERRHCSQVFIVETLLTVTQQCFTSKWRTSQWRWSKKKKWRAYDCKNEPPYPCIPAWRHFVVLTTYNHGTQKKRGKKRSQLFFQRHIEPLYWLYSMYQNCRPFWNLWHTIHWEKSHILHCKTTSIRCWCHQ